MNESAKTLLEQANKAYREGNPIMSDAEYDELEAELGLENSNAIGEKHSPELTVKHPYIMGSLSKVQIKPSKDGSIDWEQYAEDICRYVGKHVPVLATPKYDGCSFENYVEHSKVVSCSTRGDGNYGRDVSNFVLPHIPSSLIKDGIYTLRGEILVKRSVFDQKYSNEFANTRSFVAGLTGRDWEDTPEMRAMRDDLSIVIYDYRKKSGRAWNYFDWALLDCDITPQFYINEAEINAETLKDIYFKMAKYREDCEYSLDGFVIKPVKVKDDWKSARPKDCVAVKFLPMTASTVVEKITWELGKTGKYTPIIWYAPVQLDGKKCVKCSGHNYGWLVKNEVAPGAKITISMAGDIIPFCYKVESPAKADMDTLDCPDDSYVVGVNIMKAMDMLQQRIEKFRNSCFTLDVPGLGDAQVESLIQSIKADCEPDEFFGTPAKEFPTHILKISPEEVSNAIGGRLGQKIAKAYQDIISNLSLETIVESMNFRFCGKRMSKAVAEYLTTGAENFESMAREGYSWAYDPTSEKYLELLEVMSSVGKTLDYYTTMAAALASQNASNGIEKTLIIMTGEPNNYATKADFLNAHPEYEETTSWKKAQIVFTNSLESSTGKMKKAREKGIEIRVY